MAFLIPPEPFPEPLPTPPRPNQCCERMTAQFDDANGMFCYAVDPNGVQAPAVYVLSDGGHGGMEEIQFCPFCGVKFSWDEPAPPFSGEYSDLIAFLRLEGRLHEFADVLRRAAQEEESR